jgi:hypothetical protein
VIIVGFDKERELFLNAVGHVTDEFVLELLSSDLYSEFDVVFSRDALMASVIRFSDNVLVFDVALGGVQR